MFPDTHCAAVTSSRTEPEPVPEQIQPLFLSFEEQLGHLFKSNIGI